MVHIKNDVWRSEAIAAIGRDNHRSVQIFPLHCEEFVSYLFDNKEEAERVYKAILADWQRDLESGHACA